MTVELEYGNNLVCNSIDIQLDATANIVGFANPALQQYELYSTAVILYMQPLAFVVGALEEWHLFTVQALDSEIRNHLLGELVRPKVVRAV